MRWFLPGKLLWAKAVVSLGAEGRVTFAPRIAGAILERWSRDRTLRLRSGSLSFCAQGALCCLGSVSLSNRRSMGPSTDAPVYLALSFCGNHKNTIGQIVQSFAIHVFPLDQRINSLSRGAQSSFADGRRQDILPGLSFPP